MLKDISKAFKKPALYEQTKAAFWDDEYISKQMLKAHLNPDFEGASRKHNFIEESVAWIKEIVPPTNYPLLLDVGCGPGIYAEKFTKTGYHVTGIDFSKRSISYAKSSAKNQNLKIHYLYQNYLDMNLEKQFDFVTMIYCDYGALSMKDRQILMAKIYQHLKPKGKFLLDVFSVSQFNGFLEKQSWQFCEHGGFWCEETYAALNGYYKYLNHITLEQISILTNSDLTTYNLWTSYFTKETLIAEAREAGFKVCDVFSDVKGRPYEEKNPTLAILLEKA